MLTYEARAGAGGGVGAARRPGRGALGTARARGLGPRPPGGTDGAEASRASRRVPVPRAWWPRRTAGRGRGWWAASRWCTAWSRGLGLRWPST